MASLTRLIGPIRRGGLGRWQAFPSSSMRTLGRREISALAVARRDDVLLSNNTCRQAHHRISDYRGFSTANENQTTDNDDDVGIAGIDMDTTTLDLEQVRKLRSQIVANCKQNDANSASRAQEMLETLVQESIRAGQPLVNAALHNNVMDAWARSGNRSGFAKAVKMLEMMHQRHQKHPSCCPSPNTISYHSALHACARGADLDHPEAAATAEKVIKEMEQHSLDHPHGNIHPDTKSYSLVILTHANQARETYGAAGSAEDWLHYLSKLNTEGGPGPTTYEFNLVLKAWKACPEDKGADRALEVLNLMIKLFRDGHQEIISPDEISFGLVIGAFADRNRPEEGEDVLKQALSFFLDDETVKRNQPDRRVDLRPCFNLAINGWARCGGASAPERSAALLMDMRAIARETQLVLTEPDVYTHTSCMDAVAKSGREDAPEIVESRLYSMLEQYRNQHYAGGGSGAKGKASAAPLPNAATFDCAIRTWHKSEKPDRAQRMEALLNTLIDLGQRQNDAKLRPKPRTVSMCINAWGRTDIKKALSLLNRMEIIKCVDHGSYLPLLDSFLRHADESCDDYSDRVFAAAVVLEKFQAQIEHRGILRWPSDPQTLYNQVLFALMKLGTGDAADRAFALLEGMEGNQNKRAKPSIASYSCVIRALSKEPNEARTKKAFAIFDHATKLHHDKTSKVMLDTQAFLAMMSYLANLKQRWAADRAYDLLGVLTEMHSKSGNKELLPNYRCYDKCLQALARCEDLESLELAVKMLKRFVDDFRDARAMDLPSEASFNTLMKFCVVEGSKKGAKLSEEVSAIKDELRRDGHLREFSN